MKGVSRITIAVISILFIALLGAGAYLFTQGTIFPDQAPDCGEVFVPEVDDQPFTDMDSYIDAVVDKTGDSHEEVAQWIESDDTITISNVEGYENPVVNIEGRCR